MLQNLLESLVRPVDTLELKINVQLVGAQPGGIRNRNVQRYLIVSILRSIANNYD